MCVDREKIDSNGSNWVGPCQLADITIDLVSLWNRSAFLVDAARDMV